MLSDGELRALSGIERKLEAEDPRFVARCARLTAGGTRGLTHSGYDASVLLPVVLAIVSTAVLWSRRRGDTTYPTPPFLRAKR